jgi:hypothetical protein
VTKKEKAYTKELPRKHMFIEHINAKITTFKSMAYPYRGHCCNRYPLRMTLICGIINYDRKAFRNSSPVIPYTWYPFITKIGGDLQSMMEG